MSVAVMKTKAELALAEQFRAVESRLPGGAAVKAQRAAAMATFVANGLPHRRLEAWKYTDLRSVLTTVPPPAEMYADDVNAKRFEAAIGGFKRIEADIVAVIDGTYSAELSRVDGAPGLRISPLASFMSGFPSGAAGVTVEPTLLANPETAPVTAQLNSAFATDGIHLSLAAGAVLDRPLIIVHACSSTVPASITTRHYLNFAPGTTATVIELFVCLDGAARGSLVNTLTSAIVGDRANITHVKAVLGHGETHLSNWTIDLGTQSTYRGFQYTESPALARHDITVTYRGPGAKLDLSGAFLATGNEHIDTTLVVDHAVPSCESRELFKGVLAGRGRGIFQGKIVVRQIAQKTDGKQMAQALMLSPDAEFDSKPELEIYADDVVCGHGATVIDIDQDHLFYLRARGIPLIAARAMLVEAFVGEALDRIEHEAVRHALLERTHAWLAELKL